MTVVALPNPGKRLRLRRRAPQIIEAAARVFAERGYHGATTQDIADVLGIRQASLYYYFPSKEARWKSSASRASKASSRRPRRSRRALAVPPTLARLIDSHLSPLLDRSDFVKVFLNERQHLPTESRRRIGKGSRALERDFEDVLREGVRKGEFRSDIDTRLAMLAVLGMMNAVADWYAKGAADRR